MGSTAIEWATDVWNPVTGCTKVSQGCRNCYAERMAKRLAGRCGYPADEPFRVTLHPDRLDEPLGWRKPRRVFVNSMSDLFHTDVPDDFLVRAFSVMEQAHQHVFQVLTKRPERMRDFLQDWWRHPDHADTPYGPAPNIWLGVSVEDQATADERIPLLLQTPAAVRFLSLEPLLGPVDLTRVRLPAEYNLSLTTPARINALTHQDDEHFYNDHEAIDWVIVGGESGPGARYMDEDWVRQVRDECVPAGVPFYYKQRRQGGRVVHLPELDGQVWDQLPPLGVPACAG